MALGTCAFTTWLGRDVLGLGFKVCNKDCFGASVTDALLTFHASASVVRIRKVSASNNGPLAIATMRWPLVNAAWSATGVVAWLQPDGSHPWWFEYVWRCNAQVQACLVVVSWLTVRAMLRALGWLTPRASQGLWCLAIAHGLVFALITSRPATCAFQDYVLFGGANLSPPLLSLFVLLISVAHKHKLPASHPLCQAIVAAVPFWVGNAGILLGRSAGPAAWLNCILPTWWQWEEMATFHVFGGIGNELLWRAFAWMAEAEATAMRQVHANVMPPDSWLERALGEPHASSSKPKLR